MGCSESTSYSLFAIEGDSTPLWRKWRNDFESLSLTERDIGKFHRKFKVIEINKINANGTIEWSEVLKSAEIKENVFFRKAILIFDLMHTLRCDFRQFVFSIWNICSLGPAGLASLSYNIYNEEGLHVKMPISELKRMINDIHGEVEGEVNNIILSTILSKLDTFHPTEGGVMSEHDFQQFVHTHPAAFSPALDLQQTLQNCYIGASFWKRMAEIRLEKQGSHISVKALQGTFAKGEPKIKAAKDELEIADHHKKHLPKAHAPIHPTTEYGIYVALNCLTLTILA